MSTARPDRSFPVAALLVALWLVAFLRALSRVFVLNFSTAGPNATGLLSLLLVTGWTVPLFARVADRRRAWHLAMAIGLGGLVLSLAGGTLVALAGALAFLLATTPHLLAVAGRLGDRFATAAAVGLLGHHALRALLDTAPPYATTAGRVALVALAGVLAVGWWLLGREGGARGVPDRAALGVPAGVAATVFAFLSVQGSFLGLPARVALWADRPYPAVLVASVAGLLLGAALVARWRVGASRGGTGAATVGFVVGLGALLFTDGVFSAAAALPAQAAAVVLLAAGCRGWSSGEVTGRSDGTRAPAHSAARAGGAVSVVQTAGLALAFLVVSAANWAFVPGVGPLTRDRGGVFLFALGGVLPVAALVARRHAGRVQGNDSAVASAAGGSTAEVQAIAEAGTAPEPEVSTARRSVLTATGAGLVGLAGAGYHETRPVGGDGGTDAVDVLSFNVHQYLDSDGDYNLRAVRDVIRATGADVVGLQETDGGRLTAGGLDGVGWLGHELGYHHAAGPGTRAASYGVGLLSRWPVRGARVVELPARDTAPRVALAAVVESPFGDLPVVVAHTEVAGAVRVAQTRRAVELARELGADRAVLLGDFNATPDERPYELLTAEFEDPWAGSGAAGNTFSASDPRRRIDYVFAGSAWRVERGEVVGSPDVSDHLGVSARLRERE